MVQKLDKRIHRFADNSMLIDPPRMSIHFTLYRNFNFKTMAMHLRAFMIRRYMWQGLSGLKAEDFCDTSVHNIFNEMEWGSDSRQKFLDDFS